jgi:uncharacterized RDD family membrane protein YckC
LVTSEHTPQQALGTEPAGLLRRLAALAYDTLLLTALLMCFTLVVLLVRGGEAIPAGTWWFQLALLAVTATFFAGFWTHGGQTLGMRAWRLRVVAADGGAVSYERALLRFVAAWISLAVAGLGFWWSLVDPERCCWHDRLSGTRVVRLGRASAETTEPVPLPPR